MKATNIPLAAALAPKGDREHNTLYCSFCGKSQHEVRKLVAGPTVFICNECNELVSDLMDEEKWCPVVIRSDRYHLLSDTSACSLTWRGFRYSTLTHAFCAEMFTDIEIIARIIHATTAYDAERIVHDHDSAVRPDWDNEYALKVIEELSWEKLRQHPMIQDLLRKTGDREIVENSTEGEFWGRGRMWNGQNHRGKIWMKLRERLVAESAS